MTRRRSGTARRLRTTSVESTASAVRRLAASCSVDVAASRRATLDGGRVLTRRGELASRVTSYVDESTRARTCEAAGCGFRRSRQRARPASPQPRRIARGWVSVARAAAAVPRRRGSDRLRGLLVGGVPADRRVRRSRQVPARGVSPRSHDRPRWSSPRSGGKIASARSGSCVVRWEWADLHVAAALRLKLIDAGLRRDSSVRR